MIVLKKGSHGRDVVKLQLILNGFLNPGIKLKNDGFFGNLTEDAVKMFQKKKGLSVDGIVGPNTWNALVGSGAISNNKIDLSPSTVGAPWYDVAVAEIGVKELAGPALNNKRILEYHKTTSLSANKDEVPWLLFICKLGDDSSRNRRDKQCIGKKLGYMGAGDKSTFKR